MIAPSLGYFFELGVGRCVDGRFGRELFFQTLKFCNEGCDCHCWLCLWIQASSHRQGVFGLNDEYQWTR